MPHVDAYDAYEILIKQTVTDISLPVFELIMKIWRL